MLIFETVIALLLAGALLTVLAKRLRAPYPALLALAGTAGSRGAGRVTRLLPGVVGRRRASLQSASRVRQDRCGTLGAWHRVQDGRTPGATWRCCPRRTCTCT